MRRRAAYMFACVLAASMLAACGLGSTGSVQPAAEAEQAVSEAEMAEETVEETAEDMTEDDEIGEEELAMEGDFYPLWLNTEGRGWIAFGTGEEAPEFEECGYIDDMIDCEIGDRVIIGAKPRKGWKFLRWMRDGQEVSTEQNYLVTTDGEATYTAVFGLESGEEVSLDLLKTAADLFLCVDMESEALTEYLYTYAFELNGGYYRAYVNMPSGMAEELLDFWSDMDNSPEDYDALKEEELGPLPVDHIEDLGSAMIPQEKLASYVGKPAMTLVDEGWEYSSNDNEMGVQSFIWHHNLFAYKVEYDKPIEGEIDFYEGYHQLEGLTIKSIEVEGLGFGANQDIKLQ